MARYTIINFIKWRDNTVHSVASNIPVFLDHLIWFLFAKAFICQHPSWTRQSTFVPVFRTCLVKPNRYRILSQKDLQSSAATLSNACLKIETQNQSVLWDKSHKIQESSWLTTYDIMHSSKHTKFENDEMVTRFCWYHRSCFADRLTTTHAKKAQLHTQHRGHYTRKMLHAACGRSTFVHPWHIQGFHPLVDIGLSFGSFLEGLISQILSSFLHNKFLQETVLLHGPRQTQQRKQAQYTWSDVFNPNSTEHDILITWNFKKSISRCKTSHIANCRNKLKYWNVDEIQIPGYWLKPQSHCHNFTPD